MEVIYCERRDIAANACTLARLLGGRCVPLTSLNSIGRTRGIAVIPWEADSVQNADKIAMCIVQERLPGNE